MHLPPEFRDVGAFVNRITKARVMKETILYRSGELALVRSLAAVGNPRTIINLEITNDPRWSEDVATIHLPIPDTAEVYDTGSTETRKWIDSVLNALSDPDIQLPVLIHCTAGKDRTGVVIAALLASIRISPEAIVREYCASEGPLYADQLTPLIDGITRQRPLEASVVLRLSQHYKEPEQNAGAEPPGLL